MTTPANLSLLPIAAMALMFCAMFMFVFALSPKPEEEDEESDFVPLAHRGQLGAKRAELREKFPLYALILPFVSGLGRLLSMLPLEAMRVNIRKMLVQAGNPGALTPDEFLTFPIYTVLLAPGVFYTMANAVDFELPPYAYGFVALLGAVFPFIWLNDTIKRRQQEIRHSMPHILDMLTLSIEAGLDFISAVEKIVSRKANQGPLSEELYIMLQELRMGKTRREALRDMARRVSLDTLNSVVASLVQADHLGTPLGPILRIQSDMLRIRRSQEAEKAAMEAAVKLLFPLLFIFIAVMLILLGPMFLRLEGTLL